MPGDLIKHGLLAEFTKWRCHIGGKAIRFVDPFGGRPWADPPVPTVPQRIKLLSDLALSAAQPSPETRYYGSGHIVRHVAEVVGRRAEVLVSDRNRSEVGHQIVRGGSLALQRRITLLPNRPNPEHPRESRARVRP